MTDPFQTGLEKADPYPTTREVIEGLGFITQEDGTKRDACTSACPAGLGPHLHSVGDPRPFHALTGLYLDQRGGYISESAETAARRFEKLAHPEPPPPAPTPIPLEERLHPPVPSKPGEAREEWKVRVVREWHEYQEKVRELQE